MEGDRMERDRMDHQRYRRFATARPASRYRKVPAALALGLAADRENYKTALAAILGVMILCAARRLLRKYIKDLI